MKASRKQTVSLANYQENRIRAFHQTLERYLAGEFAILIADIDPDMPVD